MLDVISKTEYFLSLDDIAVSAFLKSSPHDLKRVQDAYIYSLLKSERCSKIIEVGGGNSRVLKGLDCSNELWNLDEFIGRDGGPSSVITIDGVKTVVGRLGAFSSQLPSNYFDMLFSVSVVEHLPTAQSVFNFFSDGARILKEGGVMHHAIDLYLQDEPFEYSSKRVEMYSQLSTQAGLIFVQKPAIDANIRFRCSYATNPDLGIYAWNKMVPQISEQRLNSQSVSLKMALKKIH